MDMPQKLQQPRECPSTTQENSSKTLSTKYVGKTMCQTKRATSRCINRWKNPNLNRTQETVINSGYAQDSPPHTWLHDVRGRPPPHLSNLCLANLQMVSNQSRSPSNTSFQNKSDYIHSSYFRYLDQIIDKIKT